MNVPERPEKCQWPEGCDKPPASLAVRSYGNKYTTVAWYCEEHGDEVQSGDWTWDCEYSVECPACACKFAV